MGNNQSSKGFKMLPALVSLWKKTGKRWYRYNETFRTSDNMDMQRVARLMKSGWVPYQNVKSVNDTTKPLEQDIFDVPTKQLDEIVQSVTPVCRHIPSNWYELLKKPSEKPQEVEIEEEIEILPLEEDIKKKVLDKAVADYKAGKTIPPYLIKDVMRELFGM